MENTETTSEQVEEIVFGHECYWCKRKEPCDCHDGMDETTTDKAWVEACKCSCGRCKFVLEYQLGL